MNISGQFLVDVVAAAVKKIRNRPKAVARRARKAARKAQRPHQPDEAAGEFFTDDQEVNMLKGKKTYLGLAAVLVGLVLGAIGFGECDPNVVAECVSQQAMTDRLVAFLNEALEIGGLMFATYGRAQAGK